MSNNLTRYKCDHLFLLVGKNPLPNYVAARLLLKEGGTVYWVHSPDTADFAERLQKAIGAECRFVEVEEANPERIFNQVRNCVSAIGAGVVGLNYTGGTKAMSVHAYRAIEEARDSRSPAPIYSYLDARTLELVIDPRNGDAMQRIDVSLEVKPSLQDLLALHDWEWEKPPERTTLLKPLYESLMRIHTNKVGIKAWRGWCNNVLRVATCDCHNLSGKKRDQCFESAVIDFPADKILQSAVDTMRDIWNNHCDDFNLGHAAQISGFAKSKHLYEWLDGKWLEHYVLDIISQIAESCQLHDYGMSLKTPKRADKPEFELDLVALRGYRLFAISCTTDYSMGRSKSKLFEVYVRARQLGGSEARIGFIGCYQNSNEPDILDKQIRDTWDAETGQIKIFGPNVFTNLSDYLTGWFKDSTR